MLGVRPNSEEGRLATASALKDDAVASGLHDVPAGGTIFDRTFAALGFCGAILGSRHAASSGFFSHGMDSSQLGLRTFAYGGNDVLSGGD